MALQAPSTIPRLNSIIFGCKCVPSCVLWKTLPIASISGYFGGNRVHYQKRREDVRIPVSVPGGCSCLMMMPICTGSRSRDSPILLVPCSPISDALLRCAAQPVDGEIFMVSIPVAKCAEPSNLRATRSWGRSTGWKCEPFSLNQQQLEDG